MYYIFGYYIFGWVVATGNVITENVINSSDNFWIIESKILTSCYMFFYEII